MANPSKFTQSYDFSDYQQSNPSTPLPGVQVDIQLSALEAMSIDHRDAIMDVRRSDGALKNQIVTEDSLADGLIDTLTAATDVAGAAASAAAAAASADEAEASAFDAAQSAIALETIAELLENGGLWTDYGSITETATSSADYGSIV